MCARFMFSFLGGHSETSEFGLYVQQGGEGLGFTFLVSCFTEHCLLGL